MQIDRRKRLDLVQDSQPHIPCFSFCRIVLFASCRHPQPYSLHVSSVVVSASSVGSSLLHITYHWHLQMWGMAHRRRRGDLAMKIPNHQHFIHYAVILFVVIRQRLPTCSLNVKWMLWVLFGWVTAERRKNLTRPRVRLRIGLTAQEETLTRPSESVQSSPQPQPINHDSK